MGGGQEGGGTTTFRLSTLQEGLGVVGVSPTLKLIVRTEYTRTGVPLHIASVQRFASGNPFLVTSSN